MPRYFQVAFLILASFIWGGWAFVGSPLPSSRGAMLSLRSNQGRAATRPLRRAPMSVAMAEGGKGPEGGGDEKSFVDKVKAMFKDGKDGKGSPAEQNLNYLIDLVTLTAGAAVFTCLLLNLSGKVPCI